MAVKNRQFLVGGMLLVLLGGCVKVGPDYQPPAPRLPAAWGAGLASGVTDAEELTTWWRLFGDAQLDQLILRARAANLDLRSARARLRQARAEYRMTGAAQLPQLAAGGEYTNSRRSENVSGGSGATQNLFQAGFDVEWELDLFGGARRASEAAAARLEAAGELGNEVLVSLEAEVARNYLELRATQQRLLTARETLAAREKTLELARGREESGFGSRFEVAQAETELALARVQLPVLENGGGQAIFRLGLLLGLPPQALRAELALPAPLPELPTLLPQTLPSQLLRRRPDIRRAERELAATTAEIGVASAELFPSFSLTGLIGLQSNTLGDLLRSGSRYWSAGPGVRWSLFNAGRVRAAIRVSEARRDLAQIDYERAVLNALGEVESALLAVQREEEVRATLSVAEKSGALALDLADGRYRAGLSDLLDVLQSERTLYQTRDQLLLSRQRLALDLVTLFKALGGGWEVEPPPNESNRNAAPTAQARGDEKS